MGQWSHELNKKVIKSWGSVQCMCVCSSTNHGSSVKWLQEYPILDNNVGSCSTWLPHCWVISSVIPAKTLWTLTLGGCIPSPRTRKTLSLRRSHGGHNHKPGDDKPKSPLNNKGHKIIHVDFSRLKISKMLSFYLNHAKMEKNPCIKCWSYLKLL